MCHGVSGSDPSDERFPGRMTQSSLILAAREPSPNFRAVLRASDFGSGPAAAHARQLKG
jgi:hypothetical protein